MSFEVTSDFHPVESSDSHPERPGSRGDNAGPGLSHFAIADAQIARMRAAAGISDSEAVPAPADASSGPQAAPGALILNTGQIEAIPSGPEEHIDPSPEASFHRDGYLYDPAAYSWPKPRQATACGAPFTAVRGCGCGVKAVRQHCDKRGCSEEYCRGKIRERRARKIKARLDAGRTDGRAVIYTVFTVPPERRGAAADRKLWKKWIDRLLRYMKKELALDYAVERTDPCGEDGETWHPHVNLLWIRRQGFRGFIKPEQLADLKAKWASIVYGGKTTKPISVHTAFSTDEARIWHWCRYMGRTWSRWEEEFPYHLRIKWLGRAPKTPIDVSDSCCPKCAEEIVRMQFGSVEAAADAAKWTYQRLRDEVEAARFERMRKFGKWREVSSCRGL